ncbi:myosin heavy chain IB-like [Macrobrachium nipponense]|uniref:myosin heavy chain IB-like n=1 Tax=Macrobrachium nipponense TaxID=159736 RepID=UPI0030C84D6F
MEEFQANNLVPTKAKRKRKRSAHSRPPPTQNHPCWRSFVYLLIMLEVEYDKQVPSRYVIAYVATPGGRVPWLDQSLCKHGKPQKGGMRSSTKGAWEAPPGGAWEAPPGGQGRPHQGGHGRPHRGGWEGPTRGGTGGPTRGGQGGQGYPQLEGVWKNPHQRGTGGAPPEGEGPRRGSIQLLLLQGIRISFPAQQLLGLSHTDVFVKRF